MFNTLLDVIGESIVESVKLELVKIGLKKSNIINNITYTIENNRVLLILPDYYIYIESGRDPLKKKIPINILVKWLKQKNIQAKQQGISLNQLAWMIQRSIYLRGIKARPFLQKGIDNSKSLIKDIVDITTKSEVEKLLSKFFKK